MVLTADAEVELALWLGSGRSDRDPALVIQEELENIGYVKSVEFGAYSISAFPAQQEVRDNIPFLLPYGPSDRALPFLHSPHDGQDEHQVF